MSVDYVTKVDLVEALAPIHEQLKKLDRFVTKEDLKCFVTKEDMQKAIADAIEPVHRHIDSTLEKFKSEVRLLADGYLSVDMGQSKLKRYMQMRLDQQDARIDRLDAKVYLLNQRVTANGGSDAAARLALSASTQA